MQVQKMLDQLAQYDRVHIASTMQMYGGHFMSHLADALIYADRDNTIRLLSTWGYQILDMIDTHGIVEAHVYTPTR